MFKDIKIDPEGYYLTANLIKAKGKVKSICMVKYGDHVEVQLLDEFQDDEADGGEVLKTIHFDLNNITFEQAIHDLAKDNAGNLRYFVPRDDHADDINNPDTMKVVRKHYKLDKSVRENVENIMKKKIMIRKRRFQPNFMLLVKACHVVKAELTSAKKVVDTGESQ